jgi:hypothetical protein
VYLIPQRSDAVGRFAGSPARAERDAHSMRATPRNASEAEEFHLAKIERLERQLAEVRAGPPAAAAVPAAGRTAYVVAARLDVRRRAQRWRTGSVSTCSTCARPRRR